MIFFFRADIEKLNEYPTYLYIAFNFHLGTNLALIICTYFVVKKAAKNDIICPNIDQNLPNPRTRPSLANKIQRQKTLQELKVIDPENPDDQNMESWSFNKGPFLKQFKSKHDNNEQMDVVSLSNEVVENHI